MTNSRALVLVLDSADPEKLAQFYAALLGAEIQVDPDLAHLHVVGPHSGTHLTVRRSEGMIPQVWSHTADTAQSEVRLSVPADQLDAVEREIIGLGRVVKVASSARQTLPRRRDFDDTA